jgi:hypothetical protein
MAEIGQSGASALEFRPRAGKGQGSNLDERGLAKILAMRTQQQNGPSERTPAERVAVLTRGIACFELTRQAVMRARTRITRSANSFACGRPDSL